MIRVLIITFFYCIVNCVYSQIIIDENFDDWVSTSDNITDPISDGLGTIDFKDMQVYNDSEYLYYRFTITRDINLQEDSKVLLYIDSDNNSLTGKAVNGLGADIMYDFGERSGYYYRNSQIYSFLHDDCGLLSLPTVTSSEFEFAIKRKFNAGNYLVQIGSKIKVFLANDFSGGDKIPDQAGGFYYSLNDKNYAPPVFEIEKNEPDHLRIMSYNVKQDGIFDSDPPFKRKIKAIRPDILCFQEIYNHSSGEMNAKIRNYFGGTWYDAKIGSDIIVVSKYPISRYEAIGGNGIFQINYNGNDLIIINVHFYCCDNDSDRQVEVDEIVQFIRQLKNGTGPFSSKKNTPIIITGDTNFVGSKQQRKTLIQGDIVNESKYGKDFLPDWDNSFLEDAKPHTTGYPGSFTWNSDFSSYPAGRLDYVIYTGSVLQLENTFVLCTDNLEREILDEYQLNTEDSFNSSDHLPIVADFSLKTPDPIIEITHNNIIKLYPNPAREDLNIDINQNFSTQYYIVIINPKGMIAYHNIINGVNDQTSYKLDISNLKSSYYYILLYDNKNKLIETSGFVKD